MCLALASHGDLVLPHILHVLWHKVTDLRRHISWAYGIRPCESYPLDRQAAYEMYNARLGGVVRGLQLRDVDDMTRHTSRSDKRSTSEVLERLAIDRCAFLLLASPVLPSSAGTVECAVEIGCDDFAVVVNFSVEHGALGPGDTGIGDEDVEAAIEFLDDVVDGFLDGFVLCDINLVGFAWKGLVGFSFMTCSCDDGNKRSH